MEETFLHQHQQVLCQGIAESWLDGTFTDVTLCVGSKEYSCHKVILSALSSYFNAMFRSGMKESRDASVVIQNIDSHTFDAILKFIYTGHDVLTKDNVESLLEAAVMLQISCLQEQCEVFLKKHIGPENCLGVWRLASNLGCSGLAKKTWTYILECFQTIQDTEEFNRISVDDLITIINDNDLNTSSEEAVCDAVLKWVRADFDSRGVDLVRLFSYIRFPLISLKYIESLQNNAQILCSEDTKAVLKNMHDYLSSSASNGQSLGCSRQFNHRQEEMMCIVGTRSRHPNPQTTEIKCFSFRRDAEYGLAALPAEPGACFAVCKLDSDIYVSGGYHGQTLFLHYVSKDNRWQHCSPMLEGRWGHSMVAVNGKIYILGGSTRISETLSSIECYDPKMNQCQLIGDLTIPVSFVPTAAIGDKIFIFGGKMQDRTLSTKVQCFDTRRVQCMVLDEMPLVSCTSSRVAILDDTAYVFYRHGDIVQYKQGSQAVVIGHMPNFDHFGVMPHEGQVLIVGSQSNQYSTVLFNPITREMTSYNRPIKAALCNFYCMSVVMSKQHLQPESMHT